MQLTFGDAEGLGQRKRTRREIFLAEMDQVVPWKALLKLIEPHYPKMGRPGRQPYPLATMLRIHFLQQWYGLSDERVQLCGREIVGIKSANGRHGCARRVEPQRRIERRGCESRPKHCESPGKWTFCAHPRCGQSSMAN